MSRGNGDVVELGLASEQTVAVYVLGYRLCRLSGRYQERFSGSAYHGSGQSDESAMVTAAPWSHQF